MQKSEIKAIIKEVLIEELKLDELVEASQKSDPMYGPDYFLVVTECAGDVNYIHHMGNDIDKAGKEFRSLRRDYDRYGLGGGDSTIIFYEYTGRPRIFRDVYKKWQATSSLEYNRELTEFGIELDDLLELDTHYA